MIAGIKKAFIANLPQVKWMDEETKAKALNKVNRVNKILLYCCKHLLLARNKQLDATSTKSS